MTVKELKEKLNEFDDHLIVMIPNQEWPYSPNLDVPAKHVSQGVNEFDGCLFIDDYEEKDCETCTYYDVSRDDQPCCSCVEGENWEKGEVEG